MGPSSHPVDFYDEGVVGIPVLIVFIGAVPHKEELGDESMNEPSVYLIFLYATFV